MAKFKMNRKILKYGGYPLAATLGQTWNYYQSLGLLETLSYYQDFGGTAYETRQKLLKFYFEAEVY